ncbi:MAG: hypothetical protein RLZZ264_86 [Bacillota bacterium]|jgi:hypothetical protein
MLENLWLTFEVWILSLGLIGVFMVFVLAVLHPTLEGPAAILLLTILTIFLKNVWLASALLWLAYTIGFSFFYILIHWLHKKTNQMVEKYSPTKKAIEWVRRQPTWKHILVIGMPLVYTYPLRIAFTIQHQKFYPFFWQTFLQYGVLTVGNLLIYFGIMQLIFFNLPIWVVSIVLAMLSTGIYLIRTKVKII